MKTHEPESFADGTPNDQFGDGRSRSVAPILL